MSRRVNFTTHLVLFMLLVTPVAVIADALIMTAPPRENPAKGQELYGPIAKELSQLLGKEVVYEQPKNWAHYAKKMRENYYDIVFDGPHFNAWRQKNLKHIPLVSLPGHLEFYIVTRADYKEYNNARDLVGRKICGMPSPHLATDLVYDIYKNPVVQPHIFEVHGGQRAALQAFKDGKCVATIFRTTLFDRLPEAERKKLKVVARTRSLPNQTISVSKKLEGNRDRITKFFLSNNGKIVSDALLSRYSKSKKQFIKANPNEFVSAEDILEGVVWGW